MYHCRIDLKSNIISDALSSIANMERTGISSGSLPEGRWFDATSRYQLEDWLKAALALTLSLLFVMCPLSVPE